MYFMQFSKEILGKFSKILRLMGGGTDFGRPTNGLSMISRMGGTGSNWKGTFYIGEIKNLGVFSTSKGFKNFLKINEKFEIFEIFIEIFAKI